MKEGEFKLTFAYGSNMCSGWLLKRVPGATYQGVASLAEHQLRFHKRSRDDSGKGDAWETGESNDKVWGVVVRVPAEEKPALDRAEGLGRGYTEKCVSVVDEGGATHAVWTYVATDSHIDRALRPYQWYLDLVVRGAERHGIQDEYVEMIRATRVIDDPSPGRRSEAQVECA